MDLNLRKATEADLDSLDKVMLVISDAAGDRETGTICGSLFGVVFEDICDSCRPILLVENVAVLESYQGKGVGRAMFQEIERWSKEQWDCHYEILASGLNRTGAHKFYHALGFQEVKGFKKYL